MILAANDPARTLRARRRPSCPPINGWLLPERERPREVAILDPSRAAARGRINEHVPDHHPRQRSGRMRRLRHLATGHTQLVTMDADDLLGLPAASIVGPVAKTLKPASTRLLS